MESTALTRLKESVLSFLPEVIIIFFFIFLINNYLGNSKTTINADGVGYYDYLPSIFIHKDLMRKDQAPDETPAEYRRIDKIGAYVIVDARKVNKYPVGTALLQTPFFVKAWLTTDLTASNDDGYQAPFQEAVFHAAIFYLFLSLVFLRKLLREFHINRAKISIVQIMLVFATPVTYYAHAQASYSHVYSLFAITALLYFVKAYFDHLKLRDFIWASVFLGLVMIIRPVNGIIIFFVPFLTGSIKNLKTGIVFLFKHKMSLFLGVCGFLIVISIQLLMWYLQTGKIILYSYPGEGFNFLKPEMIKILFSYKKGLFVYTPVLLLSLIAIAGMLWRRDFFRGFTWLFFFLFLTWILSSWWSWYYGASYGLRAYVDFLAVFLVPVAIMLQQVNWKMMAIITLFSVAAILLNIVQTYQYKNYMIHWMLMDKDKYWKTFLKTQDRYNGLVWKKEPFWEKYEMVKEIRVGDFHQDGNLNERIFSISSSAISQFEKVGIVQVEFENDFDAHDDTRIVLDISNEDSTYYHQPKYLIHFHETELNTWHTGKYNYVFKPVSGPDEKIVSLEIRAGGHNVRLNNIIMRFYKQK